MLVPYYSLVLVCNCWLACCLLIACFTSVLSPFNLPQHLYRHPRTPERKGSQTAFDFFFFSEVPCLNLISFATGANYKSRCTITFFLSLFLLTRAHHLVICCKPHICTCIVQENLLYMDWVQCREDNVPASFAYKEMSIF